MNKRSNSKNNEAASHKKIYFYNYCSDFLIQSYILIIDTLKINFPSHLHPLPHPSIPHLILLQSNYNLFSFCSSKFSFHSLHLLFTHLKSHDSSSSTYIFNHTIQHNPRILNNFLVWSNRKPTYIRFQVSYLNLHEVFQKFKMISYIILLR